MNSRRGSRTPLPRQNDDNPGLRKQRAIIESFLIFQEVGPAILDKMARSAQSCTFTDTEELITEGSLADASIYFIVKGNCQVTSDVNGIELQLPPIGVGEHFPHIPQFRGAETETSPVKVTAVDDVECLAFRMGEFMEICGAEVIKRLIDIQNERRDLIILMKERFESIAHSHRRSSCFRSRRKGSDTKITEDISHISLDT
ncbi:hypothetical protein SeLEV6574_g02698 [Synchytrium endobioticum]|uniref:Cyclic nucleotide-binding domain-containing protein n=1 Tax=Synchytrium endobioticum TaxID=286115 RepID=A0A507D7N2_9FUNG|nr:hypothetical protein SeLEV6574_g02698 [Synchytrium endobioticum]